MVWVPPEAHPGAGICRLTVYWGGEGDRAGPWGGERGRQPVTQVCDHFVTLRNARARAGHSFHFVPGDGGVLGVLIRQPFVSMRAMVVVRGKRAWSASLCPSWQPLGALRDLKEVQRSDVRTAVVRVTRCERASQGPGQRCP